jgi:hypothetical protein
MLARTVLGLLTGLFFGTIVAAALVFGLGQASLPFWLATTAIALTGALVGLVAGKPIWAEGARIEAGLKSGFGALMAGVGLFLLHRYTGIVSATVLPIGHGAVRAGEVSVLAFPLVAATLTTLFEIDNTPEGEKEAGADAEKASAVPAGKAEKAGRGKIRVAPEAEARGERDIRDIDKSLDEEFPTTLDDAFDGELTDDDRELMAMLDAKEKKRK